MCQYLWGAGGCCTSSTCFLIDFLEETNKNAQLHIRPSVQSKPTIHCMFHGSWHLPDAYDRVQPCEGSRRQAEIFNYLGCIASAATGMMHAYVLRAVAKEEEPTVVERPQTDEHRYKIHAIGARHCSDRTVPNQKKRRPPHCWQPCLLKCVRRVCRNRNRVHQHMHMQSTRGSYLRRTHCT